MADWQNSLKAKSSNEWQLLCHRDAQSSNQDLSERTVDGLRHKMLELQQLEV